MRHISVWRRVVLGAILAASFSYAHAADVNAHIKGTVTDAAGAVVAKASVIATNEATGVKYTTESSGTGEYLFPQLPIGTYTVKVSAPGFKEFSATGITLNIAQEFVESVVLTVGCNLRFSRNPCRLCPGQHHRHAAQQRRQLVTRWWSFH